MIDKLHYLVALAREQSFRKAAEACGVAQPSLSAGIKQLEEDLGVLLVRRTSRYQGLTPEGERVLLWAKRLTADASAMRRELHLSRRSLAGHLRIAVIPTALAALTPLTGRLARQHPALRLTILSSTSNAILAMLQSGDADAGVTYLDNEALGRVRSVPLFTERYRLVVRRDHPLAGRAEVRWAELAGMPLCLLTTDMQNRRIMDRIMRGAGLEPEAAIESNSPVPLLAHVLDGVWATVLPESLADTLALGPDLARLRLVEPDMSYEIGLVVQDQDPMPLLVSALLRAAVDRT